MPAIWQLFVDETGSFAKDPTVALVGVLVRAYDSPQLRVLLKSRIERAFPLVDYPPHANVLNLAVSRAVYAWPPLSGRLPEGAREALLACEPAIALLRESMAAPARSLRERVNERPVEFETIKPANDWLAGAAAAAPLQGLVNSQSADFSRALADTLDKMGPNDGNRAFAAAVVSTSHDGGPARRYEHMLAELLRMLSDIMPNDTQLWLRVARPTFGGWSLDGATLHGIATRAKTERVEFIHHPPVGYRGDVHPGVVVADFAANRLGQVLRARPRSIDELLRGFEGRVSLPLTGPLSGGAKRALSVLGGATDTAPWAHPAVTTEVGN